MRLMSEQTRRRGGVLIEPLEPDDSDERCIIIPTIHPHYIELPKLCTESISTEPQTSIVTISFYSLYNIFQATAKEDDAQQISFAIRE